METEVLTTVITAVFTIISPVVIQWRKQPGWPTLIKVGLPVLVSLLIAIGYLMASGALAEQQLLPAFLIVYGLQQLVYSVILKNINGLRSNDGKHEVTAEQAE
ncbi:hypothetical protein CGQ24_08135 [Arthrobacter sp. 7749]|nr:hypothetical protein CGQ24_08135 [Arthrobacter sp. 7749]